MSPGGRSPLIPFSRNPLDKTDTIVVVDDYVQGRYIKTRALSHAGFHVLEASTGEEALRTIQEHRPAVVVLDVKLPDVNGFEVCRAIKTNPDLASTIVLQVSAYFTATEHQIQGFESGADAYLPGDTPLSLLIAKIRALLRTSRAQAAAADREHYATFVDALDRSRQDLRDLSASLLKAQEDERHRIARELHDDFAQRLAALEIDLTRICQERGDPDGQLQRTIRAVSSLSLDLRNLTHDLHPIAFEHLGFEVGVRSLIQDFERTHDLPGQFIDQSFGRALPQFVSTVLYRITQEALRNVVKHAGDARVTITLSATEATACVTIEDDGNGFDPEMERERPGLGIVSMRERARLVGGNLEITSAPGRGTIIKACVPLIERPLVTGTSALQ